jgi:hypothetical protein
MEFGHTRPSKPRSRAIARRSTPNGLPASAPEPRGRVPMRGRASARRASSRAQAAAWERSQCDQRTVWAGCKCVNPGISTPTSASARATAALIRLARWGRVTFVRCACSQRRVSVATWSLRERPVCSLPPTAPTSSVSRRSLAVWMSSSPGLTTKASASHSAATASRPATMVAASSAVSTPHAASARAYAWLPFRSSRHSRRSKGSDSLKASMRGSVAPVKRPPHSFFSEGGAAADDARGGGG